MSTKFWLVSAMFCMLTGSVFAAKQYCWDAFKEQGNVQAFNSGKKGNEFKVLNDTSLTLTEYRPTYGNTYSAEGYKAWGYFTFDEKGVTSQSELKFDKNGQATINELKAGENFGFWITTNEGKTLYSSTALNDTKTYYFNGRGCTGNYQGRYWTFTPNEDGNNKLGNKHAQVLSFTMNYGDPVPSGKPLPGVLVTAAICSLVGAAAFRRGKRSVR